MIINGDSSLELKKIKSNSIATIITDPPYGLGMSHWDFELPEKSIWEECERILKPGGLLLSFSSRILQHKISNDLEASGLYIRDYIVWAYGTGMNRSIDLGKSIDRINGITLDERRKVTAYIKACRLKKGYKKKHMLELFGSSYTHFETSCLQAALPSSIKYQEIKKYLNMDDRFDYIISCGSAEREIVGIEKYKGAKIMGGKKEIAITKPRTEEAKKWDGWRSGLRPAFEPIIIAQKKISEPSITENVLRNSCGGFNINECKNNKKQASNLLHDGSDCLESIFNRNIFYCAKPTAKERKNNTHPTVKPIALMEYLVRLVVPQGETVLDPFMGSGTTLLAAKNIGVDFIGIEKDKDYFEIAKQRLNLA